jgi:hypothetical protein
MRRMFVWLVVALLLAVAAAGVREPVLASTTRSSARGGPANPADHPASKAPYRGFVPTSFWNTRLPADAPVDRNSARYIGVLKATAFQYPRFAGVTQAGTWGLPVYWATRSDPVYNVTTVAGCPWPVPAAYAAVRIPRGARPDASEDAQMTVYDRPDGLVVGLWHATYDPARDTWQACAGSAYYLASNGLYGGWARSTDGRNTGHRGLPPSTHAVRWDEIQAGAVRHVLDMIVPSTCGAVFPMVWGEGCGQSLLEGMRIRIKPSVDLTARGLTGATLTVATALQRYGAVVGDVNGCDAATIRVENTVQEGRGWLWNGVLGFDSLNALNWNDFEVIQLGWGR